MNDGASWAPSRRVFLRRTALLSVFTFALLALLGLLLAVFLDLRLYWVAPTALLLTVGFLIDDAGRWRSARFDRWQIEEGQLLHSDREGMYHVPLAEISAVRTGLSGRVIVELHSGQRLALRYLEYPEQTAKALRNALPA